MTYNAEIRGFLGYYALADNLKAVAANLLWMTTTSFLRTLAGKRKSTLVRVARSLKRGPSEYVVTLQDKQGSVREYRLVSSTKQLLQHTITRNNLDLKPDTYRYMARTELGQRLLANECEWCASREGLMEVHHVRKLADLSGKAMWEQRMIARQRKTMVLCEKCHDDLHAGRLGEATTKGRLESRIR